MKGVRKMLLTDKEIVEHLIKKGKIKRPYWDNVTITAGDDGVLHWNFADRMTAPLELTVLHLAADDWEAVE